MGRHRCFWQLSKEKQYLQPGDNTPGCVCPLPWHRGLKRYLERIGTAPGSSLAWDSGAVHDSRKAIELKKCERMFKEVGSMKNARRFAKEHNKHK